MSKKWFALFFSQKQLRRWHIFIYVKHGTQQSEQDTLEDITKSFLLFNKPPRRKESRESKDRFSADPDATQESKKKEKIKDYITFDDIKEVASNLGEDLNDEELQEMIEFASNGKFVDGRQPRVTNDQFFSIMRRKNLY